LSADNNGFGESGEPPLWCESAAFTSLQASFRSSPTAALNVLPSLGSSATDALRRATSVELSAQSQTMYCRLQRIARPCGVGSPCHSPDAAPRSHEERPPRLVYDTGLKTPGWMAMQVKVAMSARGGFCGAPDRLGVYRGAAASLRCAAARPKRRAAGPHGRRGPPTGWTNSSIDQAHPRSSALALPPRCREHTDGPPAATSISGSALQRDPPALARMQGATARQSSLHGSACDPAKERQRAVGAVTSTGMTCCESILRGAGSNS
jgi:hypothetical protein